MPTQTTSAQDKTAGINPAAPWRISALSVLPDYRLAVTFNDGVAGVVDCSGITTASDPGMYAPLAAADFFAQARLEFGAVTWPNGADLDPAWLHGELEQNKSWSVPF